MATKTKNAKAAAGKKVVKRGLKPRTTETYDKEEFMHGDSAVPPNDHTLNTALCRIRLELPRPKEGVLVYRPWPAPHPDQPEERFQRGRVGAQPKELGNWIFPVRAASFLGLNDGHCEKHTFLLYQPGAEKDAKENNPLKVLYRACKKAFDSGSFATGGTWDARWNKILKGSDKGSADLTGPTTLWYTQGQIYANGDKDYLEERSKPLGADKDDELTVVRYSPGGGKSVMEMFGAQKKEWEGDEEKTPAIAYIYGDPIGSLQKDGTLKGGWIFHIWNPKRYKFKPDGRTSWGGKVKDQQGYEVHIAREYEHDGDTFTSTLDAENVKAIFAKYQYWMPSAEGANDGLLYFPPVEQQCLWIAKGFRTVPKLLQFGWADHPEFFTEEVRAVLKARVQAVVPGSEDEEEEEDEDTPKKKKSKKAASKKGKSRKDPTQEVEEEEEPDEELDEEPLGDDEEEEEEEDEDSEEEEEEESDDEEEEDEDSEEEEESDDEEEEEEEDEDSEEEEESDDEEEEDEDSEEEEESDDEEEEEEEGDEDEEVPEEFRLDEEDEESAEFDPDEEVDDKKKAMKDKMKKSLKDAKGRSGKRSSAAKEPPKAPPKKKSAKGKTAAAVPAKPAKKAPAKKPVKTVKKGKK